MAQLTNHSSKNLVCMEHSIVIKSCSVRCFFLPFTNLICLTCWGKLKVIFSFAKQPFFCTWNVEAFWLTLSTILMMSMYGQMVMSEKRILFNKFCQILIICQAFSWEKNDDKNFENTPKLNKPFWLPHDIMMGVISCANSRVKFWLVHCIESSSHYFESLKCLFKVPSFLKYSWTSHKRPP